jgi:hypothetical protein
MQKRVAPASRAARARASTSSTCMSGSAGRPVSWRTLCGQYAQSSGQAPVLMDSSVLTWTSWPGKRSRCTPWARYSSSNRGRSNRARTSSRRQSKRGSVMGGARRRAPVSGRSPGIGAPAGAGGAAQWGGSIRGGGRGCQPLSGGSLPMATPRWPRWPCELCGDPAGGRPVRAMPRGPAVARTRLPAVRAPAGAKPACERCRTAPPPWCARRRAAGLELSPWTR